MLFWNTHHSELFLLADSITVMASYSDVVVLRHPEPGAVGVTISISLSKHIVLIFNS